MKKRWLIGIILLVIIIVTSVFTLLSGKKCSIDNSSNCDTSCQTDSDCEFVCGCGAINKDEECDTNGKLVDCIVPREIKCKEGKCVVDNTSTVAEVSISTDKTGYKQNENINITIESNKEVYFYNHYYEEFDTAIEIRQLNGSEWNILPLGCSFSDCRCVSGALECAIPAPAPIAIEKLESLYSFYWNQEYCTYENKNKNKICGNYTYNEGAIKQISQGNESVQLKVRFCYWDKEDIDPELHYVKNLANKKCAETNLTVNPSSTAKYCSNYTTPMTEKEREECLCPEGKEKFQGYIGAYCAANSQIPCDSKDNCPEGESCTSSDGEIWKCTGLLSGCYYNNPENPDVMICVD